jgi:hypothetical protein
MTPYSLLSLQREAVAVGQDKLHQAHNQMQVHLEVLAAVAVVM